MADRNAKQYGGDLSNFSVLGNFLDAISSN
jgi:hypothetical protein